VIPSKSVEKISTAFPQGSSSVSSALGASGFPDLLHSHRNADLLQRLRGNMRMGGGVSPSSECVDTNLGKSKATSSCISRLSPASPLTLRVLFDRIARFGVPEEEMYVANPITRARIDRKAPPRLNFRVQNVIDALEPLM
ncbi:unnamed protein product, partial [Amoebophrya sp. A25]